MFPKSFRTILIAGVVAWAPIIQSAPKEYIFSAAPTENVEKALAQYRPLVDYLSKQAGVAIRIEIASNYTEYSLGLIENRYDITFDGPHFTAWRIKRFNHHVLARFPGDSRFVVLVREDAGITKISKLAGKRVCSLGPPNFTTMAFLDLFADPASTPVIVNVKEFGDAVVCAQQGKGVAAVTRDRFWLKLPDEKKSGLRVLYHSPDPWPERAFSASDRMDAGTREKLQAAFLSPEATIAGAALLKNFKLDKFISATNKDYQGFERLLRHIWGFHDHTLPPIKASE